MQLFDDKPIDYSDIALNLLKQAIQDTINVSACFGIDRLNKLSKETKALAYFMSMLYDSTLWQKIEHKWLVKHAIQSDIIKSTIKQGKIEQTIVKAIVLYADLNQYKPTHFVDFCINQYNFHSDLIKYINLIVTNDVQAKAVQSIKVSKELQEQCQTIKGNWYYALINVMQWYRQVSGNSNVSKPQCHGPPLDNSNMSKPPPEIQSLESLNISTGSLRHSNAGVWEVSCMRDERTFMHTYIQYMVQHGIVYYNSPQWHKFLEYLTDKYHLVWEVSPNYKKRLDTDYVHRGMVLKGITQGGYR